MNQKIYTPLAMIIGSAALMFSGCATPRTARPARQPGPPPRREMPARFEDTVRPEQPAPVPVRPAPVIATPPPFVVEPLPPAAPVEPPAPREGISHTIRRGETLSSIAVRHNISWRQLADHNRIADPNAIRVGQTILIPVEGASPPASAPSAAPAPRPAPVAGTGTHVVQSGDNLTHIARRYNTTVRDLKAVNNLTSDTIRVGQRLTLPSGASTAGAAGPAPAPAAERAAPRPAQASATPAPSTPAPRPASPVPAPPAVTEPAPDAAPADDRAFEIQVDEGDTLESISQSYWIPVEALRRENNLGPNEEVRPGQSLRIPPTTW